MYVLIILMGAAMGSSGGVTSQSINMPTKEVCEREAENLKSSQRNVWSAFCVRTSS